MKQSEYFTIKDNFKKTAHVSSIPIIESKLDFVPKVTIAIPTYKRTDLLYESLQSAVNQINYEHYEIIIVDNNPERDCATEKMLLSVNCPRLSYYKNAENIGVVGNLNRMYTLAKGKYVVELHDDDLLYPDYLSVMMKLMQMTNEKYDAVYPETVRYNMNNSTSIPERALSDKIYIQNVRVNDFLWNNFVGQPRHLTKKNSFLKIGGYCDEFYPVIDLDLYVKFAYYFKTCIFYGHPLTIYRISKNISASTQTLLGFVTQGTKIRKNIINHNRNKMMRFFWLRYLNVFAFRMLHYGKNLFQNNDLQIKKELLLLGFHYNKFDVVLFKLMKLYKILTNNMRRTQIEII